jgi:NADH:ubiquinone oxidoreductase subunit K
MNINAGTHARLPWYWYVMVSILLGTVCIYGVLRRKNDVASLMNLEICYCKILDEISVIWIVIHVGLTNTTRKLNSIYFVLHQESNRTSIEYNTNSYSLHKLLGRRS